MNYRDADGHDALLDALATEDPEHRTRGLHESPSRFLARTNFQTVTGSTLPVARPALSSPVAGLPGAPSSSVGASGELQGGPGWSPDRQ